MSDNDDDYGDDLMEGTAIAILIVVLFLIAIGSAMLFVRYLIG